MYSDMSSVDQGVGVAEQELGQCLREKGLAHAGRADEDERTHRSRRILETGSGLSDRPGDRLHGVRPG